MRKMQGMLAELCLALAFGFVFSIAAFAQSDVGAITGFVRDPSGAVIPSAKVTITNEGTHNKLYASTTLSLDATLTVGQPTETVEVSATAEVLQTESGAVQAEVTGRQVQDQELNGRNPIYMAQLLPGVRSGTQAGTTLGDFNFSLSNGGYEINGARSQDTIITMDGAPAVRT